jgi:chromosome segregation ATPase
MDDAMLAESELVDAYMKRSEMRNTLLDLKDKLTRFRNSNDDLRKKINDMRAQKRLVEVVDQLVNLI